MEILHFLVTKKVKYQGKYRRTGKVRREMNTQEYDIVYIARNQLTDSKTYARRYKKKNGVVRKTMTPRP